MITKNQVASDLRAQFKTVTPERYFGVFLDGELLDIRDNHGRFFRTKAGANMSLLNQNAVLWGYIHSVATPTARYGGPDWREQYAVQCSEISEVKSQYKSAIKELIKDGMIEIKLI